LKRLEVTVAIDQSEKVEEVFRQMELVYTFSIAKVGEMKNAVSTPS